MTKLQSVAPIQCMHAWLKIEIKTSATLKDILLGKPSAMMKDCKVNEASIMLGGITFH